MTVRGIRDRDNPFLSHGYHLAICCSRGHRWIRKEGETEMRETDEMRTRNPRWRHLSSLANPCLGNTAFLGDARRTRTPPLFFHYCRSLGRMYSFTPNPLILEKWSCLQQTDRKTAIVHLLLTDAKSLWIECRLSWPFPSLTMLVLATEIHLPSWMTREKAEYLKESHTHFFYFKLI